MMESKSSKEAWDQYCEQDNTVPLFFRSVWLNAVVEHWEVLLYYHQNVIIASYIYHSKSKYGLSAIINPMLTPYQGLWLSDYILTNSENKKGQLIKKVTKSLIRQLPKPFYYNVRMHPSIKDVQVFKWTSYRAEVKYTNIICNSRSLGEIWAGFDSKNRNHIRNAEHELTLVEYQDAKKHNDIVDQLFLTINERKAFGVDFFRKIYNSLQPIGWGKLLSVQSSDGVIHASLLLIRDHKTVYLISHARNYNGHTGATAMLIWESIKYAKNNNLNVDFEGTDLQRVEPFYRSFGGVLTPYFSITKAKYKWAEVLLRSINKF